MMASHSIGSTVDHEGKIIEEKVEKYQKSFTGSHEAAKIDTNSISHSSNLNSNYSGFGQAQKVVHFISSVKIVLKEFIR